MHALSSHDITIFLIVVGSMLVLARLIYRVGHRFFIPSLVAELLVGILLGPTVVGHLFPDLHSTIFPESGGLQSAYDILFSLSVIMLLFLSGMEIDLNLLKKNTRAIIITSLLAIFLPFGVGVWAAWKYFTFFHGFVFSAAPFVFPLIFGTILALSALPIIVRLLMEYNLLNSAVGIIIVGSALITDIVGWMLFSSILIYFNPTLENIQILYTILYIILFFIVMFILSSSKKFMIKLFSEKEEAQKEVQYDISMLLGICLLCGAFTNAINIHPTLGAFISGMVCRRIIGDKTFIFDQLKIFVMNFFAPIFFISIGLQLNFYDEFNGPMVLAVLGIACICKFIGAYLGALFSKFSFKNSTIIALCLNARGAMEIIMGSVAVKVGLIGNQLFVAFVVTAVVTSLIVQPSIMPLLKGLSKEPEKKKIKDHS